MKKEYKYTEGPESRKNFEKAMAAAFKAPKTPRPQLKRKVNPKDSSNGGDQNGSVSRVPAAGSRET